MWNGIPFIAPLTPALQTQVGTSTPDNWSLPPVLLEDVKSDFQLLLLPLLWPVISIAWPAATCGNDRNLRAGSVKCEMVWSFPFERPGHHHGPLPVHHRVRRHPHAGRQHGSRIVVSQFPLLNVAPAFWSFMNPNNETSYFPSTTKVQGLSAMAKLGVPKATENHLVAGPEIVMLASPSVTLAFNRTCVFVRAGVAS